MAHPHEDLLRREADETETNAMPPDKFYTEDHVLHYPGKSSLAGEYRGHEGLAEFGSKISAIVSSLRREMHDVVAGDEHGVQLLTVHAERKDGVRHKWKAVWVCHFRDGRISESWGHIADQEALDAFIDG